MKRFDAYHRTPLTGGFTLIEIIIVIAVIAILAGIATPSIVKNINDSRIARTKSDCKEIASAMASFYKDLGKWPTYNKTTRLGYLKTNDGTMPKQSAGWWGKSDLLDNQLITNAPTYPTTGETKWDGPYQTEFKADPWGHAYLCNVFELSVGSTAPVYVLSAGPDGILQTSRGALLAGDDIGFRIQ